MNKLLIFSFLLIAFNSYSQQARNEEDVLKQLLKKSEIAAFDFASSKVNSPFTDDYNFNSEKIDEIKEIVSLMYRIKLTGEEAHLSRKQQRMYDSLVEADKKQIDTILLVRLQTMYNRFVTKRLQDAL